VGSRNTADLLGIEIAGETLRVCLARHGPEGYQVRACARALPAGCLVSDYVVRPDALVETLREALGDLGTRPHDATLALSGERTVCRVEPLAVEDDRHALAACDERLRRYVAFAGKPIVIARIFQRAASGETYAGRLVSAATPKTLVEHHVALAARCGVATTRVEPGLALAVRAIIANDSDPAPRFLLLAAGSRCEVAILRAGKLIFTRTLRVPQKPAEDPAWFLDGLDRLQEYHLRHANGPSLVQELLCCGDLEPLRGVLELAGRVGLRIRELDPADLPPVASFDVHTTGQEATATNAEFFTVVGAALAPELDQDEFPSLNLLPALKRKRARVLLEPCVLAPLLLVFALTCGLLTWEWFVRREAATLTYLMTHPTPQMLEAARLQLHESKLKERARNIQELLELTRQQPPAELFRELARRLPPGAWLDRLRLGPDAACEIDGTAQEEDTVFAFAGLLRQSPMVEEVRVARTGNTRQGGMILTDFRLEVTLAPVDRSEEPPGHQATAGRPGGS